MHPAPARLFLLALLATFSHAAESPAVLKREFLHDTAPFPSAHASTIVETTDGKIVAAYFGGKREGDASVGIWVQRFIEGKWTPPIEAANGEQPNAARQPCWNPVLFQPKDGSLMLFYKTGPSPSRWWGMLRTSADAGATWSEARRLPDGILGPIKNKPVQLVNSDILCPTSSEHDGWRVHFERTGDLGNTWTTTSPPAVLAGQKEPSAIQPSILFHAGGKLQALGRTRDARIFETWSDDSGKSWTPLALTALPNPNAGTDAVTLRDGRHLLVYNHSTKGRSPLNVAISKDGREWQAAAVLEDDPALPGDGFAYPACIQTRDGLVHITYTWRRQKIAHVILDPAKLELRPIVEGAWPK